MTEDFSIPEHPAPGDDLRPGPFFLGAGAVIAASCLFQYALVARGFLAVSADESAHTLNAYNWTRNVLAISGTWLPLYNIITGLALRIHPDFVVTPRAVSFLFGGLVLASLGWLALELFRSRRVALLTMLLGGFFGPRVVLSSIPLTEILFIFFVVTGCACVARAIVGGRREALLPGVLSIALSTAVRYEGWVFAGSLGLCIAGEHFFLRQASAPPLRRRMVRAAGAMLLTFPLSWVALHAFQAAGDPLSFLHASTAPYEASYGSAVLPLLEHSVVGQFVRQNITTLNVLGILGLLGAALRNPRIRKWMLMPLMAFGAMAILSVAVKALPNHSFWRIPAVWSMLLIPFTACWIIEQRKLFRTKNMPRGVSGWGVAVLIAVVLLQFFLQTLEMTRYTNFTGEDLEAGRYLQGLLEHDPPRAAAADGAGGGKPLVLIETADWKYLHLMVASQEPERFLYNTAGGDPRRQQDAGIINPAAASAPSAREFASLRVRYLAFRTEAAKRYLAGLASVRCLRNTPGEWAIYVVSG